MWYPSEAQRSEAIFENAYASYVAFLTNHGRVPASREVVLDEARRTPWKPIDLLYRKMARLEP